MHSKATASVHLIAGILCSVPVGQGPNSWLPEALKWKVFIHHVHPLDTDRAPPTPGVCVGGGGSLDWDFWLQPGFPHCSVLGRTQKQPALPRFSAQCPVPGLASALGPLPPTPAPSVELWRGFPAGNRGPSSGAPVITVQSGLPLPRPLGLYSQQETSPPRRAAQTAREQG